uniref:centrosomal protein of 295 kDa-like n=1 Tax=Doryrhamphus excisus TaxID=161450 RepID=UPI0025AE5BF1|nr:centrosomal protein of 295 kDa-like [Doryrhamphus excisus]
MKRGLVKLRLSPNEEAQLIREEKERRRKLRIQQVREQQKLIALQMRQNVEQRRHSELEQLEEELREEWERERNEKLLALQALYEQSLQLVGQGQRMAKENEPDLVAIAQKEAENHAKAAARFRGALIELKSQRLKETELQNRAINARKKALQVEKARAAKVASLPPPQPHPIMVDIVPVAPHVGKKYDAGASAYIHYRMPTATVDREEDTEQSCLK